MVSAAAALVAATAPFAAAFAPAPAARSSTSLGSYLDSLTGAQANGASFPTSYYQPGAQQGGAQANGAGFPPAYQPAAQQAASTESTGLCHVPLDYFAFDNLSSKGPRATYDWGTPQDWSRKLADDGVFRAGTWYCTEGGWPSPNGKAVTEVFYVLEGHGMLGDSDGAKHFFGPGDMVTIPKGHTGRWDVNTPIHKVWAVNAHDRIEESGPIIRVQVDHYKDYFGSNLMDTSADDPLYGNTGAVASASNTFYDVGPTKVGAWASQPGSFEVACGERQWFFMLEGVMFITDAYDGTSKRCVAGDTVMLSAGWSGYVDVVEPVKKVFTVAK